MGKTGTVLSLSVLFMCYGVLVQAQQETLYERYMNDDNWTYLYDVMIERGLYASTTSNSNMSDGRITSLYGGCFLTHCMGFRSGISYITGLKDARYMKIPCLFALRTRTVRMPEIETERFGDFLKNLFLSFIPVRYEVNFGPSVGYIWDERNSFASSIDFNFRMGFKFWRVVINGNMGVNYLWTKNFASRRTVGRFRHIWFANLSTGASFRF